MSAINFYRARYGTFAHYASDACIGASLDRYGEWAESEIYELRRYISHGNVVLDVGANVGTHTVAMARLVGESGFVVAVEAQPEIHLLLSANVALNGLQGRVVALNALAGATPDVMDYTASPDKAVENFGAESFAYERAMVTAERRVTTRLPMIRIDDMGLKRCDVLKIDVEGMEIDVLRGARAVLETFRPVVYFEQRSPANFAETFALLDGFGYRMFWHVSNPFNSNNFNGDTLNILGGATELNVLCLPRGRDVPADLPQIRSGDFDPPTPSHSDGLKGEAVPSIKDAAPAAFDFTAGAAAMPQLQADLKAVLADRAVAQEIMESQQAIIEAVRRAITPSS